MAAAHSNNAIVFKTYNDPNLTQEEKEYYSTGWSRYYIGNSGNDLVHVVENRDRPGKNPLGKKDVNRYKSRAGHVASLEKNSWSMWVKAYAHVYNKMFAEAMCDPKCKIEYKKWRPGPANEYEVGAYRWPAPTNYDGEWDGRQIDRPRERDYVQIIPRTPRDVPELIIETRIGELGPKAGRGQGQGFVRRFAGRAGAPPGVASHGGRRGQARYEDREEEKIERENRDTSPRAEEDEENSSPARRRPRRGASSTISSNSSTGRSPTVPATSSSRATPAPPTVSARSLRDAVMYEEEEDEQYNIGYGSVDLPDEPRNETIPIPTPIATPKATTEPRPPGYVPPNTASVIIPTVSPTEAEIITTPTEEERQIHKSIYENRLRNPPKFVKFVSEKKSRKRKQVIPESTRQPTPTPQREIATPQPELPTPQPELPTQELPTPIPELPLHDRTSSYYFTQYVNRNLVNSEYERLITDTIRRCIGAENNEGLQTELAVTFAEYILPGYNYFIQSVKHARSWLNFGKNFYNNLAIIAKDIEDEIPKNTSEEMKFLKNKYPLFELTLTYEAKVKKFASLFKPDLEILSYQTLNNRYQLDFIEIGELDNESIRIQTMKRRVGTRICSILKYRKDAGILKGRTVLQLIIPLSRNNGREDKETIGNVLANDALEDFIGERAAAMNFLKIIIDNVSYLHKGRQLEVSFGLKFTFPVE